MVVYPYPYPTPTPTLISHPNPPPLLHIEVRRGTSATLRDRRWRRHALLLCYPPPQVSCSPSPNYNPNPTLTLTLILILTLILETPTLTPTPNPDPNRCPIPTLTLLLCYPPPQSPMAAECLAAFSGDVLVHVGEWLGDTGSPAFEQAPAQLLTYSQSYYLPRNYLVTTYLFTKHYLPSN